MNQRLILPYITEQYMSSIYHDRVVFNDKHDTIIGTVEVSTSEISGYPPGTMIIRVGEKKNHRGLGAIKYVPTSLQDAKDKLDSILVNEMNCRLLTEDEVEKFKLLL